MFGSLLKNLKKYWKYWKIHLKKIPTLQMIFWSHLTWNKRTWESFFPPTQAVHVARPRSAWYKKKRHNGGKRSKRMRRRWRVSVWRHLGLRTAPFAGPKNKGRLIENHKGQWVLANLLKVAKIQVYEFVPICPLIFKMSLRFLFGDIKCALQD